MKNTLYDQQEPACPYLGISNDPDSHMAFSSPANHCHRSKTPASINLEHQGKYCLGRLHKECIVYQAEEGGTFPAQLRYRQEIKENLSGSALLSRWAAVILFFLLAVAFGLWAIGGFQDFIVRAPTQSSSLPLTSDGSEMTATYNAGILPSPTVDPLAGTLTPSPTFTVTPFPTLTSTPTKTRTVTLTPTITGTATPSSTPSATLTITPASLSRHALDTPIGRVQKYLIHRIKMGENLTNLADQHGTTVEVILAANYSLALPIQAGALLVVPIDMTNPLGLPVFEPYEVTHEEITAEQLADVLDVDLVLFKYFNDCSDNELLHRGDWMLIPHQAQK
ncbi:MAG: hypothetical protein JXA13_01835 [Anaerolineales bacterium]|nr:hypothetical protein [Anaerolineales bacterium]